ncbi:dTDP-4-dehydrorhamnose reductase family protein [Acinetobacter nematophilus]|uniref:dTDP-4-dehydrorhamnose reductase n=1 Tax=Acinetobacter nematophilus TaxID=2994642 RepID=A0A9X3DXQ1_9GAMM|nr:SDR family oxidoreductase [Acinetobacter nematophilus]MCX5469842.1 SDR family oxidoreductase [Acinetobacter nematophilus]
MKKILILGASGMAGHVVYTYLKENSTHQIIGTTNSTSFGDDTIELDIFNIEKLESTLKQYQPDVVINCVGMLIRGSKQYPDKTIYCNAYFPHLLKRLINESGGELIHISTDCVFSGKDGGYTENSFKDAVDLYGMSKSLGEINDDINLTIRTSIIGPELKEDGEGLFHWFINQKESVTGFKSNYWSGVTTLELAKFLKWALDKKISGLYHLTNSQPISKFDLLNTFKDVYSKNVIINDDKDYVCNKSFINTNKSVDYSVVGYPQMLDEQKIFMLEHKDFYKHYEL